MSYDIAFKVKVEGIDEYVEDDCNLAYKCVELHKSFKPITRPPQSWCYVESEDTE
jgi:hypothetical protein